LALEAAAVSAAAAAPEAVEAAASVWVPVVARVLAPAAASGLVSCRRTRSMTTSTQQRRRPELLERHIATSHTPIWRVSRAYWTKCECVNETRRVETSNHATRSKETIGSCLE